MRFVYNIASNKPLPQGIKNIQSLNPSIEEDCLVSVTLASDTIMNSNLKHLLPPSAQHHLIMH